MRYDQYSGCQASKGLHHRSTRSNAVSAHTSHERPHTPAHSVSYVPYVSLFRNAVEMFEVGVQKYEFSDSDNRLAHTPASTSVAHCVTGWSVFACYLVSNARKRPITYYYMKSNTDINVMMHYVGPISVCAPHNEFGQYATIQNKTLDVF